VCNGSEVLTAVDDTPASSRGEEEMARGRGRSVIFLTTEGERESKGERVRCEEW
jgi:hypothetical protein